MNYRILQGDCLEVLRTLPAESVQCVVTSPPYYGLRDYKQDGQIGLESTPQEYVDKLVAVFREVRRVLRTDGTLWLNAGDSYSSGMRSRYDDDRHKYRTARAHDMRPPTPPGLKAKDLLGIPWRLAFALQADGWWLRSDIVWAKPNPMPESVTDRPTKSHEMLFLLAKAARYYYDGEATKEESSGLTGGRFGAGGAEVGRLRNDSARDRPMDNGTRNKRDVWTVATVGYDGAHFACFPPKLVEPCILAGTSASGVCPQCGKPWVRVVKDERIKAHDGDTESAYPEGTTAKRLALLRQAARQRGTEYSGAVKTTGWRAGCECDAGEPVPCVVLDPFCGSGTTGAVALGLGRGFIGIELNPDYIALAHKRIHAAVGMFATEAT